MAEDKPTTISQHRRAGWSKKSLFGLVGMLEADRPMMEQWIRLYRHVYGRDPDPEDVLGEWQDFTYDREVD